MSMSVKERRTEVLREVELPNGKVRIAKASSKYDRRMRYLVVEWCPAQFVGADLEEYSFRVLRDWWPARAPEHQAAAEEFFAGVSYLLRDQAQRGYGETHRRLAKS